MNILLEFIQFILENSGFDSHVCQHMQKVHTYGVNIRYITDTHYNLSKIEFILNKANAFNQYVFAQRFALSLFNVRERTMFLLLATFACKITTYFLHMQVFLQKLQRKVSF